MPYICTCRATLPVSLGGLLLIVPYHDISLSLSLSLALIFALHYRVRSVIFGRGCLSSLGAMLARSRVYWYDEKVLFLAIYDCNVT